MNNYMYSYDDPYVVLAHLVVGYYRPADVLRILSDDSFLLNIIQKETRQLDIGGWFLDCIVEDILAKKNRMEMMKELDKLAQFFFSQLDKDRLRSEIKNALSESGIILFDRG